MKRDTLARVAAGMPGLMALAVTTLPECLPFQSWHADEAERASDDTAVHAGDLVQSLRKKLGVMSLAGGGLRVTVEVEGRLLLLHQLGDDFALLSEFRADLPLGMAFVYSRELVARLTAEGVGSERAT